MSYSDFPDGSEWRKGVSDIFILCVLCDRCVRLYSGMYFGKPPNPPKLLQPCCGFVADLMFSTVADVADFQTTYANQPLTERRQSRDFFITV